MSSPNVQPEVESGRGDERRGKEGVNMEHIVAPQGESECEGTTKRRGIIVRDLTEAAYGAFVEFVFGTRLCRALVPFDWNGTKVYVVCLGSLVTHDYGAECSKCGHVLEWTKEREQLARDFGIEMPPAEPEAENEMEAFPRIMPVNFATPIDVCEEAYIAALRSGDEYEAEQAARWLADNVAIANGLPRWAE